VSALGSRYWRTRLARWPRPVTAGARAVPTPGYALVMPVPGDLPVFTHLALAGCARQTAIDRVETIVVPDRPSAAVSALVAQARRTWSGSLREALIARPERDLIPRLSNPHFNYGLQIITAIRATHATHVLLHDADLFLLEDSAHDQQYRAALDRDLDVLGVSPAWDAWFAERGRTLAATWEMTARVDWLRSFPPTRLFGHTAEVLGEQHVLDVTFYGQCNTDQDRIAVSDETGSIVHFSYLIGQYRRFLKMTATFEDTHFVLLVIRMLSDLFLPGSADAALPDVPTLLRGLTDATGRVSYVGADAAGYAEARGKLADVILGPWADDAQRAEAARALAPFDEHFGWVGGPDRLVPAPAVCAPADVTVVVPVKDRVHLLGATLDSIAAQVPPPAEVIVVDDGSADGSGELAAEHGATVIRHEVGQGPGLARNAGLAQATTTWVAFVDSDDLWLPGHLAGLLQVADGHVLASAPARSSSGGWKGNARGHARTLDAAALLVPGEGLVCSGTMVDRKAALQVGGFPPGSLAEDFALWLRLLDIGPGVETAHPTVWYREHDDQISSDAAEMRTAVDGFVDAFADRPWYTERLRRRWRSRLAWDQMRAAQRAGDRTALTDGAKWFAANPDVAPALGALLAHRRRTRLAAEREPLQPPIATPPAGTDRRTGDAKSDFAGGVHPRG
jgi:hypothetical protein